MAKTKQYNFLTNIPVIPKDRQSKDYDFSKIDYIETPLEELNKRNKAQVDQQVKAQEPADIKAPTVYTGNPLQDFVINSAMPVIQAPFEKIAKGIDQLGSPKAGFIDAKNPVAGAINVANGLAEATMLIGTVPLTIVSDAMTNSGLGKIVEPINQAFEVVQTAPAKVAESISNKLEESGISQSIRESTGISINPKTSKEITQAVNETTGLASLIGLTAMYGGAKQYLKINKELKGLGYTEPQIRKMKYDEALNILNEKAIQKEVQKAEITQKIDEQFKQQIVKDLEKEVLPNAEKQTRDLPSLEELKTETPQIEKPAILEQNVQSLSEKPIIEQNALKTQEISKIEQPKPEATNVIQEEVQGKQEKIIQELPKEETKKIDETLNQSSESPETVGITKEKLNQIRTNVGLPELEKTARQSIPETFETVKTNIEQGIRTPEMIMRDVETGNVKPETSFEASYLLKQEKNRFDKYSEQLQEARKSGDVNTEKLLTSLIDQSQKNFDSMTKAFNQPNADWGRFGRFMQELLKDDYSLERVVKRAQAESPTGEIPTDIRTRLGEYVNQLDKVRNAIDTFQQKNPNASIQDFVKSVTERQQFVERRTRRAVNIEQLKAERSQLWSDLYKQTNVAAAGIPLTPEAIKTMGRLAENYVRTGITSVEGLVDEFYAGFKGQISKEDIMKAISGYGKETNRTKNEIRSSLDQAKTEMRLLLKIEDARQGKEPIKQTREVAPKTEKIQNLERLLKSLTKSNIDVSDASKLKAQKSRVQSSIADYQRRLREGDYVKKERKSLQPDQELTNLRLQERQLKQKVELELYKQKRANMTIGEKAQDYAGQIANIPRTLMATFDLSMPLRQGLPATFANPGIGLKAFKEMHKASVSPKYFDQIMTNIENSPNARAYEKMGIQFTGVGQDLVALAKQEEAFIASKILNKIPIVKQTIGAGVRASERGALANLNLLRSMTADKMIKLMEHKGMTLQNSPKEFADVGKVINWMTGRADLGTFERIPGLANTVMFSPRTFVAKWELMNPINYIKLAPEARKLFIKAQMSTVGQGMIFLNLMKLAGAQVETDPRSSDFGKARFGNTRIDIFGGNLQNFTFMTRLAFGIAGQPAIKPQDGEPYKLGSGFNETSMLDLFARYARNKLSPQTGLGVDYLAGSTTEGQDFSEYYKGGIIDKFIPLVWQDISEAQAELGWGALGTGILGFYGAGTQTYKPKEKKTVMPKNYNFNIDFKF